VRGPSGSGTDSRGVGRKWLDVGGEPSALLPPPLALPCSQSRSVRVSNTFADDAAQRLGGVRRSVRSFCNGPSRKCRPHMIETMSAEPSSPEFADDALRVDSEEIDEVVYCALGWLDLDSVPMSSDPDDCCALFDHYLWSAVETALADAGYDLDQPAIWDCAYDAYYETKASDFEEGWIGRLYRDERRKQRERRQRLTRKKQLKPPLPLRRTCARGRASRGASSRTKGSRRVTSRSAGGGSSGDPDEPEPPSRRLTATGYRFARPVAELGAI
jgi:hypothetical protein